jgi:hypothetical protein
MPCPTCSHTLQNLGLDQAGRRTFWCPRCGTLKTECQDGFEEHQVPSLAKRVKHTHDQAPFRATPDGGLVIPFAYWRNISEAVGIKAP